MVFAIKYYYLFDQISTNVLRLNFGNYNKGKTKDIHKTC